LILDEIVRSEELGVDDESLDAEFSNTLSALSMQGMDLGKVRGGKKGQQQLAQAIAMESANRVLTRNALEMLKSIATGTYKSVEERAAEKAAMVAAQVASAEEKVVEAESIVVESEAESSFKEETKS
jgi:hypothetical protein